MLTDQGRQMTKLQKQLARLHSVAAELRASDGRMQSSKTTIQAIPGWRRSVQCIRNLLLKAVHENAMKSI
jgi:hypothetical protein